MASRRDKQSDILQFLSARSRRIRIDVTLMNSLYIRIISVRWFPSYD
ncbi:hypothetical protein BX589_10793 [Paraburkholderia fungorum]|jgi:hypothetical protein|nr:hypothetical protein BX589_10793 [Paraburkholderia fungorum]